MTPQRTPARLVRLARLGAPLSFPRVARVPRLARLAPHALRESHELPEARDLPKPKRSNKSRKSRESPRAFWKTTPRPVKECSND